MGISISETDAVFQVPYGPFNSQGTQNYGFVDLKARPDLIAALPECLGWPETRELLEAINAPASPYMTLGADQGYSQGDQPEFRANLTSYVDLCFAAVERNAKESVRELAEGLHARMSDLLQTASNELQRSLFLNVTLELQPTKFRDRGVDGWSLTVWLTAAGRDEGDARATWRIGMKALQLALTC